MEILNQIINLLALSAIGLTIIKSYLSINKMWSRKHEKVVAESISVTAQLIGVVTALPFIIKYIIIDYDYLSLANMTVKLVLTMFFLLAGIGIWVRVDHKESVWAKMKRALKLERKEGLDLINAVLHPGGAKIIVDILKQLALVDKKLDASERAFIQRFTERWNVEIDFDEAQRLASQTSASERYMALRERVIDYMNISPDKAQASQLLDLLGTLSAADGNVSTEEILILNEITGLLQRYLGDGATARGYAVVLVPQNDEKVEAIKTLFPDVEVRREWGGEVYYAGIFHSKPYAQMIAQKYQALDLFSTVERLQMAPAD